MDEYRQLSFVHVHRDPTHQLSRDGLCFFGEVIQIDCLCWFNQVLVQSTTVYLFVQRGVCLIFQRCLLR
jgi:hypothetical protein